MTQNNIPINKLAFYEKLCLHLDNLHIGAFVVNSRMEITTFNRTAELLTGYQAKNIHGHQCHQIFDNELCYGDCETVSDEYESLSCDVEVLDKQREKHIITKIVTPLYDENRHLMGRMEIFQDHSVFKELINRINYDQRQLKMILDNLNLGVFTVTRGGLITFFNTRAEIISGYAREEILGQSCSILFQSASKEGENLLKQCIDEGGSRSDNHVLITTKDNRTIPAQADYMALKNEQGKIIGGLATLQDLSLIFQLNREISNRYIYADMIGKDPVMQKIFAMIPVVADSDATVLIEAPTGTGKDLLAKIIHNTGKRADRPLVKVNCAALPDNLLESEMFGYVKGAFTGADRDKPGRFQEADGGSIFLDEIGDLPLSLQAKLLRVLEDKEFYPLGSRKTTKVDVRIIAATNQNLQKQVEEKRFREDLFYRLNVIRFELPPLKDRKGDLPLLINQIMKRLKTVKPTRVNKISERVMEILLNYNYPGNIRELENILEHAVIICQGEVIELAHLPLSLQKQNDSMEVSSSPEKPRNTYLEENEKQWILEALKRCHWHKGKAALDLDMDRTTLWRKMKKHHLA